MSNRNYTEYMVGRATRTIPPFSTTAGTVRMVNLTLFEDVETGILVTDKKKFELFIDSVTPKEIGAQALLDISEASIGQVATQTGGTGGSQRRRGTTGSG